MIVQNISNNKIVTIDKCVEDPNTGVLSDVSLIPGATVTISNSIAAKCVSLEFLLERAQPDIAIISLEDEPNASVDHQLVGLSGQKIGEFLPVPFAGAGFIDSVMVGEDLWVLNTSNNLVKINLKTFAVEATVSLTMDNQFVGAFPKVLAYAFGSIWVCTTGSVKRVDPASATVSATISADDRLTAPVSDGTSLFVGWADGVSVGLHRINPSTNAVVQTSTLASPSALVFVTRAAFDGTNLWVSTGDGLPASDINAGLYVNYKVSTALAVIPNAAFTALEPIEDMVYYGGYLWLSLNLFSTTGNTRITRFNTADDSSILVDSIASPGVPKGSLVHLDGTSAWAIAFSGSGDDPLQTQTVIKFDTELVQSSLWNGLASASGFASLFSADGFLWSLDKIGSLNKYLKLGPNN